MKKNIFLFLTALFFVFELSGKEPAIKKLKGFYIGMPKEEVNALYNKFKENAVAAYIDIETETYRDQITLDNEFSSMSNKIDIMYDDEGIANSITFEYKTVNILFDANQMNAEDLVRMLEEQLQIEMEFKDLGVVKSWLYNFENENIKLSVDDNKNIRLQMVKE